MSWPALPFLAAALFAAAPATDKVRAERLARGLEAQKQRIEKVRAKPEAFNLRSESPGVHFLFDAAGNCAVEERLGAVGDGGKWVCNAHKLAAQKDCVVYGFGAGSDISFEEAMASLGCEVHVFDPSPKPVARFGELAKGKKVGTGSVTFHGIGLGPVSRETDKAMKLEIDGQKAEVRTLDELAKALGHSHVDLLKMDIEGSEWATFDDLFKKDLLAKLGIKVLLAELHVKWGATPKDLIDLVDGLSTRGFVLYRKEFNPWDAGACAEYAFAQKGFLLE
ncbi:MAG TPA: FkbM family methyltransferase [Myxococcales bacterium]|jgi:FkbM family methyltransferase